MRQLSQDGPYINPQVAAATPLTLSTIEDLWTSTTYTPIFTYEARKNAKIYCIRAGGTISLTGGTAVITPIYSQSSLGFGTSLTVGTVTAAIGAWVLSFDFMCWQTGDAGGNNKLWGTGFFMLSGGIVSGSANPNMAVFGGTQVNADMTFDIGIQVQKTLSAVNSVITQYVYMFARN